MKKKYNQQEKYKLHNDSKQPDPLEKELTASLELSSRWEGSREKIWGSIAADLKEKNKTFPRSKKPYSWAFAAALLLFVLTGSSLYYFFHRPLSYAVPDSAEIEPETRTMLENNEADTFSLEMEEALDQPQEDSALMSEMPDEKHFFDIDTSFVIRDVKVTVEKIEMSENETIITLSFLDTSLPKEIDYTLAVNGEKPLPFKRISTQSSADRSQVKAFFAPTPEDAEMLLFKIEDTLLEDNNTWKLIIEMQ